MKCPKCKTKKTQVYNSRPHGGTVHRFRSCDCGHKFKTHEVVLDKPAKVARFGARRSKNVKKKVKKQSVGIDKHMINLMSDDELMDALASGKITPDMLD